MHHFGARATLPRIKHTICNSPRSPSSFALFRTMSAAARQIKDIKTVVVLGGAYGGMRAARILAAGVPEGWRIVLIDRNTHTNHVYVLPRYTIVPGHEYKAFVPRTRVFQDGGADKPHVFLHSYVTSIHPHHVTISKPHPELGFPSETIPFDYAVYALGSHLPAPLQVWGASPDVSDTKSKPEDDGLENTSYHGLKSEGIDWLKRKQKLIQGSESVLVVGGGALGIQFATDIKAVYPTKKVTLLHSRERLLPRYDEGMHNEILQSLQSAGIEVVVGERLDLDSVEGGQAKTNEQGQKVVRTLKGREIAADILLLCTGQSPNTGLLRAMDPATINPENKLAHVLRTLQLGVLPSSSTSKEGVEEALDKLSIADKDSADASAPQEETPYPNIFVIGDSADAFGANAAGHNAAQMGEVAANNIIRLMKRQEKKPEGSPEDEPLEPYEPSVRKIKISLGLTKNVFQIGPKIGTNDEGKIDMHASNLWKRFGFKIEKDEDMLQ